MELEGASVFFGERCNPLTRIDFIQEGVSHGLIEIRVMDRVGIMGGASCCRQTQSRGLSAFWGVLRVWRPAYSSGRGLPFVSGAKGKVSSAIRKMAHMVIAA